MYNRYISYIEANETHLLLNYMTTLKSVTKVDLMNNEINRLQKSDKDIHRKAASVMEQLKNKGFSLMYGGKKGNGFWIEGQINVVNGRNWFTVAQAVKLLK